MTLRLDAAVRRVLLVTMLGGSAGTCLVACSAGGSTSAADAGATRPSSSKAPRSAHPLRYEVRDGEVPGLGRVLVDGDGYTLYAYVPDARGRSTCVLECATAWPPLVLPRGGARRLAGPGVDAALLGTTKRSGGALQVTYDGWPLYLYSNDHRPGEANGQGDDMGLWYVVSPGGTLDRRPVAGQKGS